MGRLLIRIDDFPTTRPEEESWRHNIDNFRRFDSIFERRALRYVLGVIPRHTTDSMLRSLGGMPCVQVALHGVTHDERFPNEFREHLTEGEVCQAILSARRPLDDLAGPVTSYIPPHNVVDARTCNALKRAGMHRLFGGPGTYAEVARYAQGIGLEYCHSEEPLEYGRSDELLVRGAVDHLKEQLLSRDVWLTLHWTWEWNCGLNNLEEFLLRLESEGCLT